MQHFAQLCLELEQTNSNKLSVLSNYFQVAKEEDKLWAIALLLQQSPNKRSLSSTLLRIWAAELSGIPTWLFEESYKVTGDVAETIALVLPAASSPSTQSLSYWIAYIKTLEGKEEAEKQAAVHTAWRQLDRTECFIFNKIITGTFRLAVPQKLMTRALAKSANVQENQLAHRLLSDWTPETTTFEALVLTEDRSEDISSPYPFHLANNLESVVETLGDIREWQVERKWDGIRGQIIVREGELFVWSRKEELMTNRFPEYHPLKKELPNGTVLDGEILACKNGKILNFNVLQTRIGRKKIGKKILLQSPVVFMAYDLLEFGGEDLRSQTMAKRRILLEQLLEAQNTQGIILLSEVLELETWKDLIPIRANARQDKCEGLMLKRKAAPYQSGRILGDWWKWKMEPLTIDAVLIYAQASSGKTPKSLTDYTFAVHEGDALVPFTKAKTGLTDKEIKEITTWIRQNTLERFGPVRRLRPQHVFEIAFDGIRPSGRHKSGVVLRAPRILRWRKDKSVQHANSLSDLKQLLKIYEE